MGYGSSADGTWPWDDSRRMNTGLISENKTEVAGFIDLGLVGLPVKGVLPVQSLLSLRTGYPWEGQSLLRQQAS